MDRAHGSSIAENKLTRRPAADIFSDPFAASISCIHAVDLSKPRWEPAMPNEELSYVMVTPYSMRKSRTGGIIARLMSRTGLDLVTARMFAPSEELTRRYADTIVTETDPRHRATQELIRDYVLKNFTGKMNGQRPRVLVVVLRGEDAVDKVHHTIGHIVHETTSGETIRDTFGDYITDENGGVVYFEPGALTAFDPEAVER